MTLYYGAGFIMLATGEDVPTPMRPVCSCAMLLPLGEAPEWHSTKTRMKINQIRRSITACGAAVLMSGAVQTVIAQGPPPPGFLVTVRSAHDFNATLALSNR